MRLNKPWNNGRRVHCHYYVQSRSACLRLWAYVTCKVDKIERNIRWIKKVCVCSWILKYTHVARNECANKWEQTQVKNVNMYRIAKNKHDRGKFGRTKCQYVSDSCLVAGVTRMGGLRWWQGWLHGVLHVVDDFFLYQLTFPRNFTCSRFNALAIKTESIDIFYLIDSPAILLKQTTLFVSSKTIVNSLDNITKTTFFRIMSIIRNAKSATCRDYDEREKTIFSRCINM